jgi:hypothetical protein
MKGQEQSAKRKNIPWLALWGAIGFGVGGAFGGAIWFEFELPQLGFAVLGAVGGAFLGFTSNGWRRVGLLALFGAIGFDVGLLIGFFIVITIWEPPYVEKFFIGAVGGAIGGASLGLTLRNWKKAGILALAGAIGFGVSIQTRLDSQILDEFLSAQMPYMLTGAMILAICGVIGGAFLGAALGYLEKRKSN